MKRSSTSWTGKSKEFKERNSMGSGLYIKGLKKPDCCTECFLCIREESVTADAMWYNIYNCYLKPDEVEDGWIRFHEADAGRQPWCPIVEVKKPHGRLIDIDMFMQELSIPTHIKNAEKIWKGWHECTIALHEKINNVPTVIEAEVE